MILIINILFILFVVLYMYAARKTLIYSDVIMLMFGCFILATTLYHHVNQPGKLQMALERYEDAPPDVPSLLPITTEEDYKTFVKGFSIYLTIYNKKSYPQNGKEWYNVAIKDTVDGPDCKTTNNKIFTLETNPVFSKERGVTLNSNRLYGPYCNNLGISLQSTFTIFLACRHGDFIENAKEIELIKLYANSDNNNGIVLFIKANSVSTTNNIHSGQLMFRFADSDSIVPCVMKPTDTSFTFDKLTMSLFFIVKDVDKIRILYMVGGSTNINELASINISETNATFSNKELVINRFQNWKGSLFNFGVLPQASTDNRITDIYSHCYSEYLKATNTDFLSLLNDYNSVLNYLQRFTKCPYDSSVCKKCNTVTKWTDINQVLNAPTECRKAIDEFCKVNTKHVMCKCWDVSYADYNSTTCKMYRNIFANQNLLDGLNPEDLEYLKNKYNLIDPNDCPKTVCPKTSCLNEALIKNTYTEYDFNKIRIDPASLVGVASSQKPIASPYQADVNGEKSKTDEEKKKSDMADYVFNPIELPDGEDNNKEDKPPAKVAPDTSIDNIYRTDPNIDYDQKNNIAFKDINNALQPSQELSTFTNKLMSLFLPMF